MLTIQNTKKETLSITLKRIASFVIALSVAYIVFNIFDYTSIAFGGFVFLFVALCNLLNLRDGISMNAVLTTHFHIEKRMDISFILNEIALLIIGMGIGILLNMLMVNNIKRIKKNQLDVDNMIKDCVKNIAKLLESKKDNSNEKTSDCPGFDKLDDFLEDSLEAAYNNAKNTLLSDTKYHISYLDMRKHQVTILKSMVEHINKVQTFIKQAQPLSYFLKKISYNFNEDNTAEELLEEISSLKEVYRREELPSTRVEFENRAILFQLLIDIEMFLKTKNDFVLEFASDTE